MTPPNDLGTSQLEAAIAHYATALTSFEQATPHPTIAQTLDLLYFVRELFVVLALASQLKLELQSKICWLTQYSGAGCRGKPPTNHQLNHW